MMGSPSSSLRTLLQISQLTPGSRSVDLRGTGDVKSAAGAGLHPRFPCSSSKPHCWEGKRRASNIWARSAGVARNSFLLPPFDLLSATGGTDLTSLLLTNQPTNVSRTCSQTCPRLNAFVFNVPLFFFSLQSLTRCNIAQATRDTVTTMM